MSIYKNVSRYLFLVCCFVFQTAIAQLQPRLQELQALMQQSIKKKDNGKAALYASEIGELYTANQQNANAIKYFDQAITYGKKASDNILLYGLYGKTGTLQADDNNYSKAIDSFQKALLVAKTLKTVDYITETDMQLASLYEKTTKYKKAIEMLEEALSLARKQNNNTLQQKCYELLAADYTKSGNKDKGAEYSALYNAMIQSRQHDEQTDQEKKLLQQQIKNKDIEQKNVTAQLSAQSQKLKHAEDSLLATQSSLQQTEHSLTEAKDINERRQLEIDLLNKDKAFAALQIKEQQANLENAALVRNFILVGTLLTGALVVVLVINYRRKLKINKKIDLQNKSIKSSINYAKRIQEAMLPKAWQQAALMPNSFILFKPRDGVSGDFYWFTEIKSWYSPDVVFAAADCTGHGVPGAFMSLIGMNALNGIITKGIAEPDQILNALDTEIRTALQQETSGNNDGMDVALCIYRKEKNILEFSGAKNPLIYIQDKTLIQVKGDVHSIGGSKSKNGFLFKKQNVNIDRPTMIYLFSDGYRDQFGGKDNTKFMSKKLHKLLLEIHSKPLAQQKEILDKTIVDWMGNYPQTDDILVMGVLLDVETI